MESVKFKNKSIKTKFLKIDEREIKAAVKLANTIKDNAYFPVDPSLKIIKIC